MKPFKTEKGWTVTLPAIVVAAAALSMLYELVLAQTMATLFGNTIEQYSLVIGLFLFGLGAGACFEAWWPAAYPRKRLVKVEILLAGLGMSSTLLLMSSSYLIPGWALNPLGWGLVLGVSCLSGMEFPLLLRLIEAPQGGHLAKLLSLEFLGTFLVTLLFPLALLPSLGLLGATLLGGLCNLLLALVVCAPLLPTRQTTVLFAFGVAALFFVWFHLRWLEDLVLLI